MSTEPNAVPEVERVAEALWYASDQYIAVSCVVTRWLLRRRTR